jgi:poly(U)-binding-splicing factor PUF60
LDTFDDLCSCRQLKVGRSANFPPDGYRRLPVPPKTRLYIANIHELLSETDLRELFEPFGPIKHAIMPPDSVSRRHKGYGYVEYERPEDALAATNYLNGLEVAFKP